MNIDLELGGYVIRIHEPHDYPRLAWPLRPFEAFSAAPGANPHFEIDVTVVCPLPALHTNSLRFDSVHGCWKLFESPSGLVIESLDTNTFQPRARALISDDYRIAHAWILPDLQAGQVGWCPMHLLNPIVEVCLLSRLSLDGGLLIHAAGLTHHDQGFLFTGPSGTGKSTISQFFADQGALVLSDERVIVKRAGPSCSVFGTPWVGSGEFAVNASAPLTRLYRISHGPQHRSSVLGAARAMSFILQQAFLPYWDRACVQATLDSAASLTELIPCYALSFVKQANVVEFVHTQTLQTTGASA